jgi:hypothetical protein
MLSPEEDGLPVNWRELMDFGDFGRRQATEDIENATQFRLSHYEPP